MTNVYVSISKRIFPFKHLVIFSFYSVTTLPSLHFNRSLTCWRGRKRERERKKDKMGGVCAPISRAVFRFIRWFIFYFSFAPFHSQSHLLKSRKEGEREREKEKVKGHVHVPICKDTLLNSSSRKWIARSAPPFRHLQKKVICRVVFRSLVPLSGKMYEVRRPHIICSPGVVHRPVYKLFGVISVIYLHETHW